MLRKIGVVLTTVTLALMMAAANAYATMMYANEMVAANPGSPQKDNYDNPYNALGPPDVTFYDMGVYGTLTLGFPVSFLDRPGIDIVVREIGGGIESVDILMGTQRISARSKLSVGTVPESRDQMYDFKFDLADLGAPAGTTWDQLILVDNGDYPDKNSGGADIDAVGVAEASVVPEPGTFLLLGTGLAGLAGYGVRFRRRKKQ